MRTKTLLLSAAALAAGLISSFAQSNVYSVNIVGYINTPITGAGKYNLIGNPLDNGTNDLVGLVDASGALPAKTQVLLWNGVGYTGITKTTSGWPSNPTISQGTGFFIKTIAAQANYTNTFVGSTVLSNSVSVPTGYTLSCGLLPFAGDLTSDTNINLGAVLPSKSQLLIWNTGPGNYTGITKTSAGWPSSLSVVAGQGFFIKPSAGISWTEKVQ